MFIVAVFTVTLRAQSSSHHIRRPQVRAHTQLTIVQATTLHSMQLTTFALAALFWIAATLAAPQGGVGIGGGGGVTYFGVSTPHCSLDTMTEVTIEMRCRRLHGYMLHERRAERLLSGKRSGMFSFLACLSRASTQPL